MVAEAGLRGINLGKFGTTLGDVEKSKFYYIDDQTGLRLQLPNTVQGNMTFNSLGHRSPEISLPKRANTVRIVFLGTSTTQDSHVTGDEASWPHRTIEELRSLFPSCNFDYVNSGTPGLSLSAINTYFEHYVRLTEPDITIIYSADEGLALQTLAKNTNHTGLQQAEFSPSWLAQHSLLWFKIEKNLEIIKLQRIAFDEVGKVQVEDMDNLTQSYRNELTRLIRKTREYGITGLITGGSRLSRKQTRPEKFEAARATLFYMPYVSIPTWLEVYEAFDTVLREVAAKQNAIVIGGHEQIPSDLDHYVDSMHFSDRGSFLMGKRVSENLASSPQFLNLLRDRGDCASG